MVGRKGEGKGRKVEVKGGNEGGGVKQWDVVGGKIRKGK